MGIQRVIFILHKGLDNGTLYPLSIPSMCGGNELSTFSGGRSRNYKRCLYLLFCRATLLEWNRLGKILVVYERASGQLLNRDKTSIFFSRNICNEVKEVILRLAGVFYNLKI